MVFPITPLGPSNPEPQLLHLGTHDASLDRDQRLRPVRVVQQHRARIQQPAPVVPLVHKKPRDPIRFPEQVHRLVEQVAAEVVDHARARRGGLVLPAPRAGDDGPVAVEVRLELDDAAEGAGADQRGQRGEVGVVAPVLVDGEQAGVGVREGDEGGGLGAGGGEGLFDEDVLLGLEGGAGEGEVGGGWGGDDDEGDGGVGEEGVRGRVDVGFRVVFGGVVFRGGVALDDGVEVEGGYGGDEGDVEDLCAEAVADYADVDGWRRHGVGALDTGETGGG